MDNRIPFIPSFVCFLFMINLCFVIAVPEMAVAGVPQAGKIRNVAQPESLDGIQELITNGKYSEAEAKARELLTAEENEHGPESLEAAKVLDVLVEALWRAGKAGEPESRALAERAVGIKEKALGHDHPEVAKSLRNLAAVLEDRGDFEPARALYERALKIHENSLGPDHPDVAKSLGDLAALHWRTGDYAGAKPLYERALAINEKALGPDHPDVAKVLNNLAGLLSQTGDYEHARALYERSLGIWEKSLGPDHPHVASCLNNLAVLSWRTGDYAGAKSLYERSLAIWEKVLGPDHPDVGSCLNNLAIIFWETGDYAGAKPLFERSLAIREKSLGPDHPEVAGNLHNLAVLLWQTGDYAGARPLHERALAIREKALGPDHPDVAMSLNSLAALVAETGDDALAQALYERAEGIWEKSFGPDHPDVAMNLNDLANLLCRKGDYARARPLYERALKIREKTLGPDHPDVAITMNSLGSLLAKTADSLEAALQYAIRSEKIGTEHLSGTARALPERQALRYASVRASGLDLALSLAAENRQEILSAGKEALDALIHSRALVLDEMASRNRSILETGVPELAELARELSSARQRLAYLSVRGPKDQEPETYRRLLDDARGDKEKAESTLAEKSLKFRKELKKSKVGLEEVAQALPQGSALVAFARYDRHRVGQKESKPVPSYLAFLITRDEKEPVVVSLGTAEEIESAAATWRNEVAGGGKVGSGSSKEAEDRCRKAAEKLRQKVWDPIASRLKNEFSHVFIVPDGVLHLVNFGALPGTDGRYLVESGPLIHYLSAERDLAGFGVEKRKGKGLLVLGGPSFDETSLFAALSPRKREGEEKAPLKVAALKGFRGERSSCGNFQTLRFSSLPASSREAGEVASLWKEAQRKIPKNEKMNGPPKNIRDPLLLTGKEANEAAFKANASARRVVHLATHGFFLGSKLQSAFETSRGMKLTGVSGEPVPPSVTIENPLLLSGLALAGANKRSSAGPEEEDGILTAEEIASMDLSGVEWAVLSACDTGAGEIKSGEGVLGLRRAFQVAGAGTLIMSLWTVQDEATREWMLKLYRARLLEGKSTSESVREASRGVLAKRRAEGKSTHPFYWAAFVAAGDWH